MSFEIVTKDALGRIGKWETRRGVVKTPNIFIVVNPNINLVPPSELKKEGVDIIITNSYIIERSPRRDEAVKQGLHKFLDFDGLIATDSGSFQAYSQGITDIDPAEIVRFQEKIDSDVVIPSDVFTLATDKRAVAAAKLKETLRRYAKLKKPQERMLSGPIQGGVFLDLRARACVAMKKYDFDVYAIGGIVPLMEQYRFRELIDVIVTCKQNLPPTRPIHAFGAGHPMVFALLAAAGCDLFDSAMYAIAARRDRYLTTVGTLALGDLTEFPCSCPVCVHATPREVRTWDEKKRELFLTKHNLHTTLAEMRAVRNAIEGGWLWKLVAQRAQAHPALWSAYIHLLKNYGEYIGRYEPVTKKSALLASGPEAEYRPEVRRANEWKKRVRGHSFTKEPFGRVPDALAYVYPFGQSVNARGVNVPYRAKPEDVAKAAINFFYGKGAAAAFQKIRAVMSSRTGRVKAVYDGEILVGTIRAADGLFVPTIEGAVKLHKRLRKPTKRVVAEKEAVEFVLRGRTLFNKFVKSADPEIHAGEEVFITDSRDRLLAVGTARLSGAEMEQFERGVAVDVRAQLVTK